MILRHPALDGVTVYVISREAVFARMLELELAEAGLTAVRRETFPDEQPDNGETWVFTVSSEALAENTGRRAHIEFGFSDSGSGRSERYFKRPFATDDLVRTVAELALANGTPSDGEGIGHAPRSAPQNAPTTEATLSPSGLIRDGEGKRFLYNGEPLPLTETEFSLLSMLFERRGEAVSREELLTRVWGRSEGENARKTNLTDVYIKYLREKLDDRYDVRLILSVRGKGYMLK